jgi:hypothetical protein
MSIFEHTPPQTFGITCLMTLNKTWADYTVQVNGTEQERTLNAMFRLPHLNNNLVK